MKLTLSTNPVSVAASRQSAAVWNTSEQRLAVRRRAATTRSGFTMVEIALCLAIVGFALVAIIGVLPAGLNVQKENREDTILNQDATVWLDAIRSGSVGYDELVDYVDQVVVKSQNFGTNGPVGSLITTVAERVVQSKGDVNVVIQPYGGGTIVGLLGTPRIGPPTANAPAGAVFTTNAVYAYVRAMSGSAVDKAPQRNPDVKDLAFGYRMVVETVSAGSFAFDYEYQYANPVGRALAANLSDVRLLFQWPLKRPFETSLAVDEPQVGSSRMVFRTQVSGRVVAYPDATDPNIRFFFFKPRDYK